MATTTIRVDSDLLQRIEAIKPTYLSTNGFFQLLAEQALTQGFTLGKPNDRQREVLPSLNKEEEVKNQKLLSESINHPPKQRKQIDPELLEFEMLIREFWGIKGGTKTETSWKMLMTGLKAIKGLDGSDATEDQLVAAINGKWKGITLRNYQQFNAKGQSKPWQQEPETRHPAFKDAREIIQERGEEWDIPSVTGGRGVLEPGAF
jgi:hypothetical protein